MAECELLQKCCGQAGCDPCASSDVFVHAAFVWVESRKTSLQESWRGAFYMAYSDVWGDGFKLTEG